MIDTAIKVNNTWQLDQHMPYAAAVMAWLGNLDSERTRRTYSRALKEFEAATGKGFDATQDDVIVFKNKLAADGLSQASINVKLSALSSLFGYLVERRLVDRNPVDGVKRRNVNPYGKAKVLAGDDAERLLASIDRRTLEGKRDYAMIRLFLATALRLGELAQLRRSSIVRHGAKAYANFTGKGGAAERVPLFANVLDALQDYLDARGAVDEDAPLFASCSNRSMGAALTERGIQSIIKARCDAVFGPGHGITPHSLRHTAAVKASEVSTIGAVSKLLRHKNLRVTTIYLDHIDTAAVDDAYAALDSAFESED